MAAVIVGDVLVPNPTAVCALMINKYAEIPGGLFRAKTDAKWELFAVLTHSGEEMTVEVVDSRESALAMLAKYAADLGLHLFAPDLALRRDIIVAIHVSQSLHAPHNWRVTARTAVSSNNTIVLHSCNSRDDAHAHMLALHTQQFAVPSAAAASATLQ